MGLPFMSYRDPGASESLAAAAWKSEATATKGEQHWVEM